jgi:hypothetical protein
MGDIMMNCVTDDEFIIDFDVDYLIQKLSSVYKLFWDGSLSMVKTSVYASESNKRFVQELLNWRTITNEDPEPPIVLVHGIESEEVIRFSLLRLKAEEQERNEEQKR